MSTISAPATTAVVRLNSLTGLRWLAAFGVFAYHMANLAPLPIEKFLAYGNYGVTFFFVLSGFVLTWSARPGTAISTFWWRRFARIYPTHFVALLLAIPVFYSFAPAPSETWVKPVDLSILFLSVLLVQGWSTLPLILFSGNPAAWTLTCEAFFYALHPAINRRLRRISSRGALLATGFVVLVAFAVKVAAFMFPEALGSIPLPLTRVTEFVIGMCLAHAFLRGWLPRFNPWWMYAIAGALVYWLGISPRWPDNVFVRTFAFFTNEWIIIVCALMIAAVAARDVRGGKSLLRSRALVWLGDLSYSFYLVHATVLYAVLEIVGVQHAGWGNLPWYALILVLALIGASGLHYLVERPFEKHLRRWWDIRLARRLATAVD